MTARTHLRIAAAVLAAALPAVAAPSVAWAHPGRHDSVRADVARLRHALAPFRDMSVAVAAGYVPTDVCTASPDGGMGRHFVDPSLVGTLNPVRPPVLLYGQDDRLLGAEYLVPDADQDLHTDADRPSIFGQRFDGPMEGHEPGMPIHYDLHVWTHKANPAGVFAPWNPRVHCD